MENLFKVDDIKVDMPSKVLSDNVAKIAVSGLIVTGKHLSLDRKSTRLNSSHITRSRMPSSA